MSRLTLYGLYNWDNTILDGVKLPDGMDNKILKDLIILNAGDLYPYIQHPDYLKLNISNFFNRKKFDFEQMYKALHSEYNPIENYNRHEDGNKNYQAKGSDKTTGSNSLNSSNTGKTTSNGTNKATSNTTDNISNTDTKQVVGYDSEAFKNSEKNTVTGKNTSVNTTSGSDTNTTNISDSSNSTGKNTTTTDYGNGYDETYKNHIHGNIGVTTNQQMIESEMEMRQKYDLYYLIEQLFEQEFIVQIY